MLKRSETVEKSFGDKNGPTGLHRRQKIMRSVENQLTIMLLLVATLFLILLFPAYFRFIYTVFAERDTPSQYARVLLVFQIHW